MTRAEEYIQLGAPTMINLVFHQSEKDRAVCVPSTKLPRTVSQLTRKGYVCAEHTPLERKVRNFEPLVVHHTTSLHSDDYDDITHSELVWVAHRTGAIYDDNGRHIATGSKLYVEWI